METIKIVHGSDLTDYVLYDSEEEKLTIFFLDTQTTWVYYGVTQEEYEELIGAKSVGNYFNHNIRNKFPCKRI